jgi:hypothetical protein
MAKKSNKPPKTPKSLDDPIRETYLLANDEPVTLLPLTQFVTATISANGALLKLELLHPDQSLQAVPVAMTRAQCTELGEALLRLAVLPHRPNQKPS